MHQLGLIQGLPLTDIAMAILPAKVEVAFPGLLVYVHSGVTRVVLMVKVWSKVAHARMEKRPTSRTSAIVLAIDSY